METANNNKWSRVFSNPDFYPTPEEVLNMMQLNVSGEVILEPSAGNGNIIDFCKTQGAKDVIFCEINEDLATISKEKARFLKGDFLKVTEEEISHVTQIIMNPPFSTSKAHLLHAWEIAPAGCEITSLFNSQTLWDLRYDGGRGRELREIIEGYGNTFDLGEMFKNAERKTDVKVSVIKLYKPITNSSTGFEGFYMDAEPEQEQENGIMKFNEVKNLVTAYIEAAKCFDEFSEINKRMMMLCKPAGMGDGFAYSTSYNKSVVSKSEFLKELQKRSWKHIFSKMNLNKYLTRGVMQDINNFVENQTQVPFTVKNIYRMFEIIVGTRENSFNRALEEAVDHFTKHTHENRFGVEGWKTNDGHMLNKKFIINYAFEQKWNSNKIEVRYSGNVERLDDLVKVLCNLTGTNYDNTTPFYQFVRNFNGIETNRWYLNGFFEFKGFKKGTMHIRFVDEKVWEVLNKNYAKIKGQVLPETTWRKPEPEPKPQETPKPAASPINADLSAAIRERLLNKPASTTQPTLTI
jgi:hypothetical protein